MVPNIKLNKKEQLSTNTLNPSNKKQVQVESSKQLKDT